MLEEKNDNLSPIENETDGNQENVSQNDIQEVIEITDDAQPIVDESVETVKEMNSETTVNEVTETIEAPESVEVDEVILDANEVVEEAVVTISAQELADDTPMSENGHQIALNAIDESNAEESEDETLKERHNIPMLEYASLSMDALVDELEKLTEVEKVMSVKDHVEEIKKALALLKKGTEVQAIKEKLNVGDVVNVMSNSGVFEEGNDALPKSTKFEVGISDIFKEGEYYFVVKVDKVLPAAVKTLDECRGKLVNEYQQYLEQRWVDDLKQEFNVKVNQDVFERVKKQLHP